MDLNIKKKEKRGKMIQKLLLLVGLSLYALALPFHTKEQIKEISSSVVKIYTASAKPDYYRP